MFKRKKVQDHLPCQIGEEFYYMYRNVHHNPDVFLFSKVTVSSITYNKGGIEIWAKYNHNPNNGTLIEINKNAFKTKAELIAVCSNE